MQATPVVILHELDPTTPVDPANLARRLRLSIASVMGRLTELEAMGLVRQPEIDDLDRDEAWFLTPQGMAELEVRARRSAAARH